MIVLDRVKSDVELTARHGQGIELFSGLLDQFFCRGAALLAESLGVGGVLGNQLIHLSFQLLESLTAACQPLEFFPQ